ncbi:MAG: helix-turn-helix transcriptional regulator [Deltaproteobacteria bacterium]|nr:helix-turn-helix transcriptional regulator [Deltaproteobacteria bacterium]
MAGNLGESAMKTELERRLQNPEFTKLFVQEGLLIDVLEKISDWMDERGIKQVDLASRLGVSRSAVSQLLSGRDIAGRDMKLKTIADVAHALGAEPVFRLREVRSAEYAPAAETENVIELKNWGRGARLPIRIAIEGATDELAVEAVAENMA